VSLLRSIYDGPAAGHCQGVLALVLLAMSAVLIIRRHSSPVRGRLLGGVVLGAAVALVIMMLGSHMCDSGFPRNYMAFGAVSVAGLYIFCGERKAGRIAAGVVWFLWFALSFWHVGLVHTRFYIGNPGYVGFRLGRNEFLEKAQWLASECEVDVGKGNLREELHRLGRHPQSDAEMALDEFLREPVAIGRQLSSWHTAVTWLWRVESVPHEVWTPGGTLSEIADAIELRAAADAGARQPPAQGE